MNGDALTRAFPFWFGLVFRLGRFLATKGPGFVILNVEEEMLPYGLVFLLDDEKYGQSDHKYRDPHAMTLGKKAATTAAFTAVSLGTSIPLHQAANFGRVAATALAFTSKAILGITLEHTVDEKEDWPEERKTVYGALRATGVPGAIHLVRPEKAVHLVAGEETALYLDPRAVEELFAMSGPEHASLLDTTRE